MKTLILAAALCLIVSAPASAKDPPATQPATKPADPKADKIRKALEKKQFAVGMTLEQVKSFAGAGVLKSASEDVETWEWYPLDITKDYTGDGETDTTGAWEITGTFRDGKLVSFRKHKY
jgi:hypothetical protein